MAGRHSAGGRELILLHLRQYGMWEDAYMVPGQVTQDGIALAVGLRQNSVSCALSHLAGEGLVSHRTARVRGGGQRRRAYFLTPEGHVMAGRLASELEEREVLVPLPDGQRSLRLGEVGQLLGLNLPLATVLRSITPEGTLSLEGLASTGQRSRVMHYTAPLPSLQRFIGRSEELDELERWLNGVEGGCIVVQGMAGIGKTFLVSRFVDMVRERRHILYHVLTAKSRPGDLLTVMSGFLRATGRYGLHSYLRTTETLDTEEAKYLLGKELDDLQGLLVLDNAHKASEEVLEMVCSLVGASDNKWLLLSRGELDVRGSGWRHLKLGGLDREAGMRLMQRKAVVGADAERLFDITGGHPYFLELASHSSGDVGSFASFVQREVLEGLTEAEYSVLAAISLSRRACPLHLLDRFLGGNRLVLNSLVGRSIVQETEMTTYGTHDVIKEVMKARLESRTAKKYHLELADHHISLGSPDGKLEAAHHLLESGEHGRAVRIIAGIGEGLLSEGRVAELHSLTSRLELHALNGEELVKALIWSGHSELLLGNWATMLERFERARALIIRELPDMRQELAEIELEMGILIHGQSLWDEAIEHLERVLDIDAAGRRGREIHARANSWLASAYRRKAEYAKAIQYLRAADALSDRKDSYMRTNTQLQMSIVYKEWGDLAKARESFERAKKRSVGIKSLRKKTMMWHDMGTFHKVLGELDEAIQLLEDVVRYSERFGDMRLLASSLTNLGDSYIKAGQLDEAEGICSKAINLFERLGDRYATAFTHKLLGELHGKRGDWQRSEEEFARSLELYAEVDIAYYEAEAHLLFGKMLSEKGDIHRARAQLYKSLSMFEEIGAMTMASRSREMLDALS